MNVMNKILLAALVLFSTTLIGQSWEQLANAPVGRHHPISFSLNGKGYAVTGSLASGQPTDDVYAYDPVSNSWSTLARFPGTARSFGIGAVSNGKAYIGFGASGSTYLRDLWSFEPATGTWTQLADCGCSGRRHPAMISIGTKIYVGLGDDASGDRNDWWMYDISANSWTQIGNLPGAARHHPYMFNADGEVYAGLGHSGGIIYKDWYKLDTVLNTWSTMNDFPGEARVAGTQFAAGGKGFVLSGDGDNHSYMNTGEMWSYVPTTDTWRQLTAHPGQSRWAPGSFVIGDDVYFFGGLNRLTNVFAIDLWKFSLTSAILGVEEEVVSSTTVYPNPANDYISWEQNNRFTEVKVFNGLGQLVLSGSANSGRLSTQELNNGLYLIQFYNNDTRLETAKILVQH
jgi:N-acetylneuraminic acid mutarotase